MKCFYCNEELKHEDCIEGFNFDTYKPSYVSWEECPICHSQMKGLDWFPGIHVKLAKENQIKYIKHLFMKLQIYEKNNFIDKWSKCNELLYYGDSQEIIITEEKAELIINYLKQFNSLLFQYN